MSFNFPNSPLQGQLYTPVSGYQYIYLDGVWRVVENPQAVGTAIRQNILVNGSCQISQERGFGSGTASAVTGVYIADQWVVYTSGVNPVGHFSDVVDGRFLLRLQNDAALSAPVGNAYYVVSQAVEGLRLAPLRWGTTDGTAIPAVLNFKIKCVHPATLSVAFGDNAGTRSIAFDVPYTGTDTWQEFTFPIPVPSGGTWNLSSNSYGGGINFAHTCGSTYKAPVSGTWYNTNYLASPGLSNLYSVMSTVLCIGEVQLLPDPLGTGIAPKWAQPFYADELETCQRYWNQYPNYLVEAVAANYTTMHMVQMRIVPAMTGGAAGFSVAVGNTNSCVLQQTTRGIQNIVANAR